MDSLKEADNLRLFRSKVRPSRCGRSHKDSLDRLNLKCLATHATVGSLSRSRNSLRSGGQSIHGAPSVEDAVSSAVVDAAHVSPLPIAVRLVGVT
jgi:hypothetical protein